jgi:hypothetical protein
MKKDAKEILNYEIFPEIGLGDDIRLGMTRDEIMEKYNIEDYIESNECTISGSTMDFYHLFDSSIIFGFIREENFMLVSILLENKFKGKYLNEITIGTPFKTLYELTKDEMMIEDDDLFIIGSYNFYMTLDFDECEKRLDDNVSVYSTRCEEGYIDTCKIESIFFTKDTEKILAEKSI